MELSIIKENTLDNLWRNHSAKRNIGNAENPEWKEVSYCDFSDEKLRQCLKNADGVRFHKINNGVIDTFLATGYADVNGVHETILVNAPKAKYEDAGNGKTRAVMSLLGDTGMLEADYDCPNDCNPPMTQIPNADPVNFQFMAVERKILEKGTEKTELGQFFDFPTQIIDSYINTSKYIGIRCGLGETDGGVIKMFLLGIYIDENQNRRGDSNGIIYVSN